MQNNKNENRGILKIANAHGVEQDYNLDSLDGFMQRYVDWTINEGNQFIQQRRKDFQHIKNTHNDVTERERNVNKGIVKNDKRLKKLINKSNDYKKILQKHGNKNGFAKFIFSNRSFWALQFITVVLMGLWSLILLLVRSNNIDVTNMFGSIIDHFGSYSRGIPYADMIIILFAGLFWAAAFGFTYLAIYYRYHIRKPGPKRQRYEYAFFTLLISIEIWVTIYAIQQGYAHAVYNKKLAEVNVYMLLFSGFPFLLAWIAIHSFYKIWVLNIRDDATEFTGEIYKKEKREDLLRVESEIKRLRTDGVRLENKKHAIENELKALKNEILAFIDKDYEVENMFRISLDNNEAICTDWENKLDAKVILSGINTYDDYKLIIKGIKENTANTIKKENKNLNKEHTMMVSDAERFLKKMKNGGNMNNNRHSESFPTLIRASLIAFIILGVVGCGGESKFFADNSIDHTFDNVLIIPDLSDRYLQSATDLFLPVEYDLEIINHIYEQYNNNIFQMYEKGLSVREVHGNICIIPAPLPHDTRWDIMSRGACWNINDLPLRRRWEHLVEQRDSLINYSVNLYKIGMEYTPTGVDYWHLLANQLPLYLKSSDSLATWNNKIVILTDGYLYFDSHLKNQRRSVGMKRDYLEESDMHILRTSTDWEKTFEEKSMGFLPVGIDYSDMNISMLVVGLNPPKTFRASAVEWQIIQKYWEDWFKSMGIKHFRFIPLHSPASQRIIDDFFSN